MQGWGEVEGVLNRVAWHDLTEVVTFGKRLEGGDNTSHVHIYGKWFQKKEKTNTKAMR